MTTSRAIRLAIKVLEREVQRLAQNANLHDRYHLNDRATINASRQRRDLQEAIELLAGMLPETRGPIVTTSGKGD